MDLTAINLRPPRLTRQGISWVSALTISKQRSTETQVVRETFGRIEVNLSGLREVLNENLSVGTRLLWLLVFTAAVLICFYQSSEVIANVFEDPSITNFRYVRNQSIEFPTVVICPCELNDDFSVVKDPVLNAAFLKERFGNASADEVLNSLQFGTLKLSELWNIYKLNITHISVLTSDNSEEVVTKIGRYSESFMISESYTSLGNCVHLRLKNNLKLYQSGSFFKLKLSGDFPFAVVAFHQEDDLPIEKYLYRRTATVVKRKSLETQYLRVTQVINRNTRKRPCCTGPTVSNCLAQCFINKFAAKETNLLCRLPYMSSFDDIQACNSRTAMETMTSAIHNATAQFDPSLCDCPKKCVEIMYVVETRHNTDSYTFGIEVYVAGVWITIMEEVAAYNLYKAFADLGGVIGLWLGTCLLGIIEFFSSCFTQLWLNMRGKKTRSLNNNGIQSRVFIGRNVKVKQNASPVTDYPGLNRVLKEDSSVWVRILWLIAFTTATTLCINQCAQQIFYYFSDPTTTNIFYTLNETIAFPSITICPKSKDGLLPAIHPQIVEEMLGSLHNNVNVVELIRKKNFTINELWNASSVYLFGNPMKDENIQRNWYLLKVSTVIGNCLNFTPRNTSKYIGLHTRKILNIFGYSDVKLIIVHPGEDLPLIRYLAQTYASEAKGGAGWISERTFRITQVSYRNTWKSPCEDHQHVVHCLVKCIEKGTYTKIVQGYCRLPYMNDANTSTPVCKSEEDLYTMLNATLSVIKTFRQEDCLCSEICRQIIYSTEYIDERTIMARGLLSVELGLRDNRVMVVEESAAYTGFALFADIGGSLGLFTGLCILNVFEIIGAFCSKLRIVIRRVIGCCWKENNNLSSYRFVRTVVIHDLHSKGSTGSEYSDINCPGFSNSANKKSPLWARLLWLIISTGACILCGYQFLERIQYCISDPTEVRMYYSYNKSIIFPLILICPFQDYSIYTLHDNAVHFLEYWNMSQFQEAYISVSINEIDDPFQGRFWQRIRNQSTHIAYYTNTRNHPIAITKEATSSGVCLVTEISNSLVYEGHRTSISVDMLLISSPRTWMAYFSRDDKQILNYMTEKRTFVATNIIKAKISLQITEVFHHNTHKNPCKNGEESATCVTNCFEEKIYSRINTKCRLPFMKESKTYPLCHNWTEYLDIKKASAEVLEAFDKEGCNCPHNCKEIIYSIEEFSVLTGRSVFLQLKLHVPDNRIAVIQEKSAYGFIRLLSDLGGSLGLFFGIGLLHMFEMMAAVATKFRTPH